MVDAERASPASLVVCAESFLKAAIHVDNAVRTRELTLRFEVQPVYTLYQRSMELALTAYLRSQGYSDSKIRSERRPDHEIAKLFTACLAANCPVSEQLKQLAQRVAIVLDDADKSRPLRDPKAGGQRLPDTATIRHAIEALIDVLRPVCQAELYQSPLSALSVSRTPQGGVAWQPRRAVSGDAKPLLVVRRKHGREDVIRRMGDLV
jgi:hypothetical protein